MKRRDFLGRWAAVGTLGAVAPSALLAAATARPAAAGAALCRTRFVTLLQTQFRIHAGAVAPINTLLTAVEDLPQSSSKVEQFSILLEADGGAGVLAAGTYPVSHRELGPLALYLEPSAASGRYRAHFGLLT